MTVTPAQLRAARGMLDWTRSKLAKASGISAETIKNIEHGIYTPQEATIGAIVKAFAVHDIEFTENEGLRRNTETVISLQGKEGFCKFMDDVYQAALDSESHEGGRKPICVSNVDDRLFVQHLEEYTQVHVERMNKLKNVKLRVLTNERHYYRAPKTDYIEYRWSGYEGDANVPFYVYGDKFAILSFIDHKLPRIVVINSPLVAAAYRKQFKLLWESRGKILNKE